MRYYVEGQDFTVRVIPFPNCKVDGAIVSDPDGCSCIYINSRVCLSRQMKALRHEIEHLIKGDLYSEEPVEVIEGRMHER